MYNHIVRMNRDGSPRNMSSGKDSNISVFQNTQLNNIKKAIQNRDKLDKIVVHVHGAQIFGDVSIGESRDKATTIMQSARERGSEVYPIMFTWDSSFADVYNDRLFRIRSGREIDAPRALGSSWGYFLADVVGTVGTSIASIASHINHVAETEFPDIDISREQFKAMDRQRDMLSRPENRTDCGSFQISDTEPRIPESFSVQAANSIQAIPIIAFSPLITSFGRSAWMNYERRTKLAIRTNDEFSTDGKIGNKKEEDPTGMFAIMMDSILELTNTMNQGEKAEVIFIGHSTGTMIISEYLATLVSRRNNGKPVLGSENIEKIVFLAGAASVGLVTKTVFPFLEMNDAVFFNITLNAQNERRRDLLLGFTSPSLLEWLDISIAEPTHPLDRVIGKWENVMLSAHTIPCHIRDRVHMKQLERNVSETHDEIDDWAIRPFDESKWRVDKPVKRSAVAR